MRMLRAHLASLCLAIRWRFSGPSSSTSLVATWLFGFSCLFQFRGYFVFGLGVFLLFCVLLGFCVGSLNCYGVLWVPPLYPFGDFITLLFPVILFLLFSM